jgi:hypothetical protein
MSTTLLSAGLACLIAAVIGGGLKAFGVQIPVLQSLKRQVILGLLGIVLILVSFWVLPSSGKKAEPPEPDSGSQIKVDPGRNTQPRPTADGEATPGQAQATTKLNLMYIGVADVLRRQDFSASAHTPDNNENRGHCPNEVGHHDGKYCTSRTTLSITTTTPRFFKNARMQCNVAGCPFTSQPGPPTISADGLTATGSLDNWGSDVEAILLVDEYERITAAVCGPIVPVSVAKNTSVLLTVPKDCLQLATLKWTLPDGSQGALSVGDKSSLGGEIVLDGTPLDRGNEMLFSYKVNR